MITLIAANLSEGVTAEVKSVFFANIAALEDFFNETEVNTMTVTLASAVGDDGETYEDVSFKVLDRYTLRGDVWVEGNRFRVNVTETIAQARKIVNAL